MTMPTKGALIHCTVEVSWTRNLNIYGQNLRVINPYAAGG